MSRSKLNETSRSSRTLTCVPRSAIVVVPSGPTMPSLTLSSPPRRISVWVWIRSLAPSATLPSATTAPAAGDSSVAERGQRRHDAERAEDVEGDLVRRGLVHLGEPVEVGVDRPELRRDLPRPAVLGQAEPQQEQADPVARIPRAGPEGRLAVAGERRLGRRLDVELAVDLAADERAADELDSHADLPEAVGAILIRGLRVVVRERFGDAPADLGPAFLGAGGSVGVHACEPPARRSRGRSGAAGRDVHVLVAGRSVAMCGRRMHVRVPEAGQDRYGHVATPLAELPVPVLFDGGVVALERCVAVDEEPRARADLRETIGHHRAECRARGVPPRSAAGPVLVLAAFAA